jgi:hypothetical protein
MRLLQRSRELRSHRARNKKMHGVIGKLSGLWDTIFKAGTRRTLLPILSARLRIRLAASQDT